METRIFYQMKPNFETISKAELRAYVLKYKEHKEAIKRKIEGNY